MKKGANVSKSAEISTSGRSTKIQRKFVNQQETPKVLSAVLNRKTQSSENLEISRFKSSSIGKLSVDKKSSFNDFPTARKVEEFSSKQMHESLIHLRENGTIQPFTFLSKILDEKTSDHGPLERSKPTQIDLQLAALTRRVRLNKSLLERTNERVKEINFLVERNKMMASRELNYDENPLEDTKVPCDDVNDNESALKNACPGIMELTKTINITKEMLGYVKKICNNEMTMNDLPQDISNHMTKKITNLTN